MDKRAAIKESMAVDALAKAGKVPKWALEAKAADDRRKLEARGKARR